MYQLIIFGPPGVGKGTQAKLLSEKLNIFHLSTGEFLRKAIEEETELGKKAKSIVETGQLVSDDIMIEIVREALKENITQNGFILDGFPRTTEQAKALTILFNELNYDNLIIIRLIADDEEIIKRLLLRGRKDDKEEIIKERLKVYLKQTEPILNYYKNNNIVIEINGIGKIEEINENIINTLKEKLNN